MRFYGNVSLNVAVVSAALFAGIAAFVSVNTSGMMVREAERTVPGVVKTTASRTGCMLSSVDVPVHNPAATRAAVDKYVDGMPQFDNITMLVLER